MSLTAHRQDLSFISKLLILLFFLSCIQRFSLAEEVKDVLKGEYFRARSNEISEIIYTWKKDYGESFSTIQVSFVFSPPQALLAENLVCTYLQSASAWPLLILVADSSGCNSISSLKGAKNVWCFNAKQTTEIIPGMQSFLKVAVITAILQIGYCVLYMDIGTALLSNLSDYFSGHPNAQDKDLMALFELSEQIDIERVPVIFARNTSHSVIFWRNLLKTRIEMQQGYASLVDPFGSNLDFKLISSTNWSSIDDLMFHYGQKLLNPYGPYIRSTRKTKGAELMLVKSPVSNFGPQLSVSEDVKSQIDYFQRFHLWSVSKFGLCRQPVLPALPVIPYSLGPSIFGCLQTSKNDEGIRILSVKTHNKTLELVQARVKLQIIIIQEAVVLDTEFTFSSDENQSTQLKTYFERNPPQLKVMADIGLDGEVSIEINAANLTWVTPTESLLKSVGHFLWYPGTLFHYLGEAMVVKVQALDKQSRYSDERFIFSATLCKQKHDHSLNRTHTIEWTMNKEGHNTKMYLADFSERAIDVKRNRPPTKSRDAFEVITNPVYIRTKKRPAKYGQNFPADTMGFPTTVLNIIKSGIHEVERATKATLKSIATTLSVLKGYFSKKATETKTQNTPISADGEY